MVGAATERALRALRAGDAGTLEDMCAVTRIPAPPCGETERAAWIRSRLTGIGVCDVATDAVGNVIARLPGGGDARPVLVAAHLDTVFAADTPIVVAARNGRIAAPGIADNGRGVAALVAIARACIAGRVRTRRPIILVATVGEEGHGDLRGAKHLFAPGSAWRDAAGFIAIDGAGSRRIVHRAVGARRLRVELRGRGGHSWADRDRANPVHALGRATSALSAIRVPERAALTVARIGGGTSVNAVPSFAWLELDLRAEGAATLARLERRARACIRRATDIPGRRGDPPLRLRIGVIGDRPTGRTPREARIVRAARSATRHVGQWPQLVAGSTDANVPMALGIEAIAIGAGGEAGGTHTTGEWFRNDGGPAGMARALLTVLLAAGVND